MRKRKKAAWRLAVLGLVAGVFSSLCMAKAAPICEYYSTDILTDIPAVSTAVAPSGKLDIQAKSVVLMEPHTGRVLYAEHENEIVAPASITKIMSLLLVMEAIENEQLTYDTKVSTSEHAASMGGSQIWLEVGEKMTVDELLRASVIASANDATVALAEAVAGSEETFVARMNQRAAELGMKNTHFVNACGLDVDDHRTTALDVAKMASALIQKEGIKKYSTVWMDALRNGKSELVNTNKLVRYYDGATGLKTGTTSKAGYCVAATAERDGMELVAVVMGGATSSDRFAGAKKLLDYGFANWSFVSLSADLRQCKSLAVKKGMAGSLTIESIGTLDVLLSKGQQDKIKQVVELPSEVMAPVLTGDTLGRVRFCLGEEELGELPVTAANTVEKATFFNTFSLLLAAALCP